MELYLLRHGIAEELGSPGIRRDRDRPLTPRGARRVRRVAEALQELEVEFDLILSSPVVRARETAEIVAGVLGLRKRLEFSEHLGIPADSRRLVQHLNGLKPAPASVLLVGHEPHLGELTSLLATGSSTALVTFRKAGLCRLEVGHLQAGRCATLQWFLTPGILCRIN